jgi:hypothetical protein
VCIRSFFFVAVLVWTGLQPAPPALPLQPNAPGQRIVVPAGGMGVVNMTMRAYAAFPKGHGFSSTAKWAELVLQKN